MRTTTDQDGTSPSYLALSHHWPEEWDRCAVIRGRHVCRRCLTVWPVAVIAMAAALLGVTWPATWDVALLLLLPVPAVADFAADQLGAAKHSAARQVWTNVPAAWAFGVGLARYMSDQSDPVFWGVCLVYGVVTFALLLAGTLRRSRRR